jgi:hypothetical protein
MVTRGRCYAVGRSACEDLHRGTLGARQRLGFATLADAPDEHETTDAEAYAPVSCR